MPLSIDPGGLRAVLAAALQVHHWLLAWPMLITLLRVFMCFPAVDPEQAAPQLVQRWGTASAGLLAGDASPAFAAPAPLGEPITLGTSYIPAMFGGVQQCYSGWHLAHVAAAVLALGVALPAHVLGLLHFAQPRPLTRHIRDNFESFGQSGLLRWTLFLDIGLQGMGMTAVSVLVDLLPGWLILPGVGVVGALYFGTVTYFFTSLNPVHGASAAFGGLYFTLVAVPIVLGLVDPTVDISLLTLGLVPLCLGAGMAVAWSLQHTVGASPFQAFTQAAHLYVWANERMRGDVAAAVPRHFDQHISPTTVAEAAHSVVALGAPAWGPTARHALRRPQRLQRFLSGLAKSQAFTAMGRVARLHADSASAALYCAAFFASPFTAGGVGAVGGEARWLVAAWHRRAALDHRLHIACRLQALHFCQTSRLTDLLAGEGVILRSLTRRLRLAEGEAAYQLAFALKLASSIGGPADLTPPLQFKLSGVCANTLLHLRSAVSAVTALNAAHMEMAGGAGGGDDVNSSLRRQWNVDLTWDKVQSLRRVTVEAVQLAGLDATHLAAQNIVSARTPMARRQARVLPAAPVALQRMREWVYFLSQTQWAFETSDARAARSPPRHAMQFVVLTAGPGRSGHVVEVSAGLLDVLGVQAYALVGRHFTEFMRDAEAASDLAEFLEQGGGPLRQPRVRQYADPADGSGVRHAVVFALNTWDMPDADSWGVGPPVNHVLLLFAPCQAPGGGAVHLPTAPSSPEAAKSPATSSAHHERVTPLVRALQLTERPDAKHWAAQRIWRGQLACCGIMLVILFGAVAPYLVTGVGTGNGTRAIMPANMWQTMAGEASAATWAATSEALQWNSTGTTGGPGPEGGGATPPCSPLAATAEGVSASSIRWWLATTSRLRAVLQGFLGFGGTRDLALETRAQQLQTLRAPVAGVGNFTVAGQDLIQAYWLSQGGGSGATGRALTPTWGQWNSTAFTTADAVQSSQKASLGGLYDSILMLSGLLGVGILAITFRMGCELMAEEVVITTNILGVWQTLLSADGHAKPTLPRVDSCLSRLKLRVQRLHFGKESLIWVGLVLSSVMFVLTGIARAMDLNDEAQQEEVMLASRVINAATLHSTAAFAHLHWELLALERGGAPSQAGLQAAQHHLHGARHWGMALQVVLGPDIPLHLPHTDRLRDALARAVHVTPCGALALLGDPAIAQVRQEDDYALPGLRALPDEPLVQTHEALCGATAEGVFHKGLVAGIAWQAGQLEVLLLALEACRSDPSACAALPDWRAALAETVGRVAQHGGQGGPTCRGTPHSRLPANASVAARRHADTATMGLVHLQALPRILTSVLLLNQMLMAQQDFVVLFVGGQILLIGACQLLFVFWFLPATKTRARGMKSMAAIHQLLRWVQQRTRRVRRASEESARDCHDPSDMSDFLQAAGVDRKHTDM